jgi:molybdopterin synthase sulfur carrier subunit
LTKVLFRTFGHLTTITKGNQLEVEFSGSTVDEFLRALIDRFGEPMKNVLYPRQGVFSDMLYVLINGKNMVYLDGPRTPVKEGDVISVLPMTAGG